LRRNGKRYPKEAPAKRLKRAQGGSWGGYRVGTSTGGGQVTLGVATLADLVHTVLGLQLEGDHSGGQSFTGGRYPGGDCPLWSDLEGGEGKPAAHEEASFALIFLSIYLSLSLSLNLSSLYSYLFLFLLISSLSLYSVSYLSLVLHPIFNFPSILSSYFLSRISSPLSSPLASIARQLALTPMANHFPQYISRETAASSPAFQGASHDFYFLVDGLMCS
jgi:hypothetical protein